MCLKVGNSFRYLFKTLLHFSLSQTFGLYQGIIGPSLSGQSYPVVSFFCSSSFVNWSRRRWGRDVGHVAMVEGPEE